MTAPKLIPPLLGYFTMAGGAAAPVATPWYLEGGVTAANCIAAYQPKGAADYATSKVNLANPGTYNAVDGAAYPTWNVSTGWTFTAGSSTYLTTGIADSNGWSWVVRIYGGTTAANSTVFGTAKATPDYNGIAFTNCLTAGPNHQYKNGVSTSVSGAESAGVFAAAGTKLFKNGSSDGTVTNSGCTGLAIHIGCLLLGTSKTYYYSGDIIALSLYDTVISDAQVIAISTAVAAL